MKIVTSYFAKQKALASQGFKVICVARYAPKWFQGPVLYDVAPTSYMLSSACSQEEYISKYSEILSRLKIGYIMKAISIMSGGKDVALCCYEKPEDFCHRHMLAEWITRESGTVVEEWKPVGAEDKGPSRKRDEVSMLDLFADMQ